MKLLHLLVSLAFFGMIACCNAPKQVSPREQLFDFDWKFHRGDLAGAEKMNLASNDWRSVDLPHDYSIEDIPGTNSPFNPEAINMVSGGFTTGGTAWYRKEFTIPATVKNKQIVLQFDGVYMNASVWLNGQLLGNHPYGYTSFSYDLTDKLLFGQNNVLAVQVRNEGQNSRWYSGSGIYRHVWLKVLDPVHIAQWGTYITTPIVDSTHASVSIKTMVENGTAGNAMIKLVTHILNEKDVEVATLESEKNIEAGASFEYIQDTDVQHPALWSPESPVLYKAVSQVFIGNKPVDKMETRFGIRKVSVDALNGMLLNGKPIKLKGGCVHNDNGPLGSKAYDRAEERRVELLKASGFNAIRCAHNPPSPAFLDACDRLGMLVIDEAFDMWNTGKNPQDYHLYFNAWWEKDIESMVMRDHNHPSVIIWSIGNEIPGMDKPEVGDTAKMLADFVRTIEPTRPITAAVNSVFPSKDRFFGALDICGYNYARINYVPDHKRLPQRVIMATESYPLETFDYWMGVLDNPWVIGDFVWTSLDYIGEASIGWLGYMQEKEFYPWNLAYCGDIDICGWKRPQSFYRDVLWNKDAVSIFVKPPKESFKSNPKKEKWSIWNWYDVVADWNWAGNEGKPLEVNVYASCEQVELFQNGKSLGKKETNRSNKYTALWMVPYEAGTLKAVGYNKNAEVRSAKLSTASGPVKIKLSADKTELKADGQDLSYVTVELLDSMGIRNPKAENLVKFQVEGPGTIVAVGNANPVSIESYVQPQRKAWQGRCLVVIKSERKAGKILLKAVSEGMPGAVLSIETE